MAYNVKFSKDSASESRNPSLLELFAERSLSATKINELWNYIMVAILQWSIPKY